MAHAANKHEAKLIGKRKLLGIYEETRNQCRAGVYEDHNGRLRKFSVNNKEIRRICNKKFRRNNKQCASGGAYRKVENYWNMVF